MAKNQKADVNNPENEEIRNGFVKLGWMPRNTINPTKNKSPRQGCGVAYHF